MRTINRINPVVRSVAVIGSVAALVGGVTFAALTSNTVSLVNNTLASATASLQISSNNATFGATAPGLNITNLVPGTPDSTFNFQLKNTGGVPLNDTINIPTNFTGSSINPADVALDIFDGTNHLVTTLAGINGTPQPMPGNPLPADNLAHNYNVKVTLAGTSTGGSLIPFQMDFVGTQ